MIENNKDNIQRKIKKKKKKALLIKLLDKYNKLDNEVVYLLSTLREGK